MPKNEVEPADNDEKVVRKNANKDSGYQPEREQLSQKKSENNGINTAYSKKNCQRHPE